MDVRAILLVDGRAGRLGDSETAPGPELMGGVPIALLDVLGKPVLLRVAEWLQKNGISDVSVITSVGERAGIHERRAMRGGLRWVQSDQRQFWRAAENCFSELAQAGAEMVLVLRVGCYAELDIEDLLQYHLDQRGRVTAVAGPDGGLLDIFVISASRRNDAAFLFRHQLMQSRLPCPTYHFRGYCNRLANAGDLRRLAVDGFQMRIGVTPAGREVRPGIWLAEGARVDRSARLVAPVFVGARSRVRARSVLTRCTVLEHHVLVDCGTVVEDSTVLPFTAVGAGLDVCHAVVGFRRLAHLRRNVEVEIFDAKLVAAIATSGPMRTLSGAVSLAGFLPAEMLRGLFRRRKGAEQPGSLPAAVKLPAPALKSPATLHSPVNAPVGGFSPNVAVARRYGDE